MDPPWRFNAPMHRNGPPYNCLSLEELKLLPIESIADPKGCVLLMWSTGTHIN